MTPDQKDVLLELYRTEAAKYDKTRDIQWRMNIALWTLIALAIWAKGQSQLKYINPQLSWGLLVTFSLIHLIFILVIHGSTERSLNRMDAIATELLMPTEERVSWDNISAHRSTDFKDRTWEVLQVGVSVIMLVIFALQ